MITQSRIAAEQRHAYAAPRLPDRGTSAIAQWMRQNGTVKFFDRDRGFGFIAPDDGSRDVFVHVSTVQRAGIPYLEQGMIVSYDLQEDSKGRGVQAMGLQLHA
jgi:cold shock protein